MNNLFKDSELRFPHIMVLKASAGAGKTRALTSRYVQFLLSEQIKNNNLRNILAITFSNNAAKEMKERILGWLKSLYFKEDRVIKDFTELLDSRLEDTEFRELLSKKAEEAIESILNNYSDFQVKTIDSFMTSIFKASAKDFGFNPDFEILMDNRDLLSYAFEIFLKDVKDGASKAKMLKKTIDLISETKKDNSSYIWDPASEIFKKWKDLYSITSASSQKLISAYHLEGLRNLEKEIEEVLKKIVKVFQNSSHYIDGNSSIPKKLQDILFERSFKSLLKGDLKIKDPPFKKRTPEDTLEEINPLWNDLKRLISEYACYYSKAIFHPYITEFEEFLKTLRKIKIREEKIFIEDVNKMLSEYLDFPNIPEVYFRLGERIYHFLIDEFQDTSSLQWKNLGPLIENALSLGGSLFVVGDTKQAIYEFRGADYRIMRELEKDGNKIFPSAELVKKELDINWRSNEKLVRFNEKLFKEVIPSINGYREAASQSGLSDYIQNPLEVKKGKGYVEVKGINKDEDLNSLIIKIIEDLKYRGYEYNDIAILARKNDHVVAISEGLNKKAIPFISYSSLDVRKRKVTSELLALLGFLDSPTDDFSFSLFLLGDIYRKYLALKNNKEEQEIKGILDSFFLTRTINRNTPLYKIFEEEFPQWWKEHFEPLFRLAGYLPLYDLLSMAMGIFRVFEILPQEEATFLKLLELGSLFESKGYGNIKDFIDFMSSYGEDERFWDLNLPENTEAVKIMTIHQSKGLEFPVTIVYLTKADLNRDSLFIKKNGSGITVMKLTKELAEKSEILSELRTEAQRDRLTGALNLLYVALTRARDELYIIYEEEEKKDKRDITSAFSPGEIFKREGEKTSGKKSTLEEIIGEVNREEKKASPLNLSHHSFCQEFSINEREIHLYEKERGEFIHRVLSYIDYEGDDLLTELERITERVNKESIIKFPLKEIEEPVLTTVQEMKKYFKRLPERIILNEREFCDCAGHLYRMDRVVIDKDQITVIDYKTGIPSEGEGLRHIEQIKQYKRVLKEIYPQREIKGVLYYIDRKEVMEI